MPAICAARVILTTFRNAPRNALFFAAVVCRSCGVRLDALRLTGTHHSLCACRFHHVAQLLFAHPATDVTPCFTDSLDELLPESRRHASPSQFVECTQCFFG